MKLWKSLNYVRLFETQEFSRLEYWSGWPFPSPRDLPNPGIKPRSPTLQVNSLPCETQWCMAYNSCLLGKGRNTEMQEEQSRNNSAAMRQGPVSSSRDTYIYLWVLLQGFPCDLAGKESTCNVGDLGLIPGLGRSSGEGKGYPLQYSSLENSDMTERLSLALHFSENFIYREQHMLPRASHFQVIFNQQNLFVEERN